MYNFSNIITELSNYDKLMIDLHLCGSDVHYGDIMYSTLMGCLMLSVIAMEELYGSNIFDIGWTHLVFIFYVSNSTELYLTFSYLIKHSCYPTQKHTALHINNTYQNQMVPQPTDKG